MTGSGSCYSFVQCRYRDRHRHSEHTMHTHTLGDHKWRFLLIGLPEEDVCACVCRGGGGCSARPEEDVCVSGGSARAEERCVGAQRDNASS